MKKILAASVILFVIIFIYMQKPTSLTKDQLTDDVQFATAQELTQLYDLELAGFGGSTLGGTRSLSLDFTHNRSLSIEEGRRLAVSCFEIFSQNINNHAALRPFLVEYPFPPSRIDISIYVPDTKKNPREADSILFANVTRGRVLFRKRNADDKLQTIHEETLEEALKIIREEMRNENQA